MSSNTRNNMDPATARHAMNANDMDGANANPLGGAVPDYSGGGFSGLPPQAGSQFFRDIDPGTAHTLFNAYQKGTLAFFKGTWAFGSDSDRRAEAMKGVGASMDELADVGEAVVYVTNKSINSTSATQVIDYSCSIQIAVKSQVPNSIGNNGTGILVWKPWYSYNALRLFQEIPQGKFWPMPGFVGKGLLPKAPLGIYLGPSSQLIQSFLGGAQSAQYGAWGLPSLILAPLMDTPNGYNDPNANPTRAQYVISNGITITFGNFIAKCPPTQNNSTNSNAILLARANQPQFSIPLEKSYFMGRLVAGQVSMTGTWQATNLQMGGSFSAGAVCDLNSSGFAQSQLQALGGKDSFVQKNPQDGMIMTTGREIADVMAPVNSRVAQSVGALQQVSVFKNLYGASGVSGIPTGLTITQAEDEGPPSTDRYQSYGELSWQSGCLADVLWMSAISQTDNEATFQKCQQLQANQCSVGKLVGSGVGGVYSNFYPQAIFPGYKTQTAALSVKAPWTQVLLPYGTTDTLPWFDFTFTMGMGQTNNRPLGSGAHVFVQISDDGTPSHECVFFGLGNWGYGTTLLSDSSSGPGGIIPGGDLNQVCPRTVKVPLKFPFQSTDSQSQSCAWTYLGTAVFVQPSPNGSFVLEIHASYPELYALGQLTPGKIGRYDNLNEGQQVSITGTFEYEVIANSGTSLVTKSAGAAAEPIINPIFSSLLQDLYRSQQAPFFKTVMTGKEFAFRLGTVMRLKNLRDLFALIIRQPVSQDIAGNALIVNQIAEAWKYSPKNPIRTGGDLLRIGADNGNEPMTVAAMRALFPQMWDDMLQREGINSERAAGGYGMEVASDLLDSLFGGSNSSVVRTVSKIAVPIFLKMAKDVLLPMTRDLLDRMLQDRGYDRAGAESRRPRIEDSSAKYGGRQSAAGGYGKRGREGADGQYAEPPSQARHREGALGPYVAVGKGDGKYNRTTSVGFCRGNWNSFLGEAFETYKRPFRVDMTVESLEMTEKLFSHDSSCFHVVSVTDPLFVELMKAAAPGCPDGAGAQKSVFKERVKYWEDNVLPEILKMKEMFMKTNDVYYSIPDKYNVTANGELEPDAAVAKKPIEANPCLFYVLAHFPSCGAPVVMSEELFFECVRKYNADRKSTAWSRNGNDRIWASTICNSPCDNVAELFLTFSTYLAGCFAGAEQLEAFSETIVDTKDRLSAAELKADEAKRRSAVEEAVPGLNQGSVTVARGLVRSGYSVNAMNEWYGGANKDGDKKRETYNGWGGSVRREICGW